MERKKLKLPLALMGFAIILLNAADYLLGMDLAPAGTSAIGIVAVALAMYLK